MVVAHSRPAASWLSWLYFSRHQSGHVRSVVAHSLPARFEIVHESRVRRHDCIVSMQALAFAGSFHFAKSDPPPSLSRCSITGSRTRAQQVEWCRCTVHVYTLRSDRLLFRLAALRPSEGPQRSALVFLMLTHMQHTAWCSEIGL